jgi:chemotaxis regulatin CheY-phosphate phosphatase CheZ
MLETEQVYDAKQEFRDFVRYVTRRFDELSAEIDANTQLLGMAENGIAGRFGEVLALLNAVSFQGQAATPHNVGAELSAVVQSTEDAANRILTAAENIIRLIEKAQSDWDYGAGHDKFMQDISSQTQEILNACAFQDLTGQRIGKTLENIRRAESELTDTLRNIGIKIHPPRPPAQTLPVAASQEEIDSLFA